ncbi:MAG: ABC transporter permease [Prevotella sp.]
MPRHHTKDILDIWWSEIRHIIHDEGLLLFLIVLPLVYPVIYSWIYTNEVVREVPVVVVDNSKTNASREFIRLYDASPNVRVAYHADNLEEARDIIGHQKAYGVVYFPEDYSLRLNRMEQATVGIYCDMSMMLVYKNVYQTAVSVSGLTGTKIQKQLAGNTTEREDEVQTEPIRVEEVAIFNTTGGYGNFILPGVLILILQQTMLLAMGMTAGTTREKYGHILPPAYSRYGIGRVISGRIMAYATLYAVLAAYILLVIPKLFGFVSLVHGWDMTVLCLSYLLSVFFFALSTMSIMRRREDVLIFVVFTSVLFLFISGVSWPASNMPRMLEYISWLIPSTFGIKGFVAMSSMGARLPDIMPQLAGLWIQIVCYMAVGVWIYIKDRRKDAGNRRKE